MAKYFFLLFLLALLALSHVFADGSSDSAPRKICGRKLASTVKDVCGAGGCTIQLVPEFAAKACSMGASEDEIKAACCP